MNNGKVSMDIPEDEERKGIDSGDLKNGNAIPETSPQKNSKDSIQVL